MRKILLSIIALCISGATFASRPLKGFRTHVQSDGKTINIQPTGNSISGFYVTNDDFALYSVDGDFFYAYLDAEGNFKNSGILAHNKEERTEAENELLKGSEYQNVASRFEYEPETYRMPQSKATRGIGSTDLATIKCTGSPKVLVVLVDFSDIQFWKALWNTFWYMIGIPLGLVWAFALALSFNSGLPGVKVFRVIYYIPVVSSIVAVALLWGWLYNGDYGLLNQVLSAIGIPKEKLPNWLQNAHTVKPAIMVMCVWRGVGGTALLYLGALQNMPRSYYEAAVIDGASRWMIFRKITWPLMQPITFYIVVTGIIGGSQMIVEPQIMTPDGGPDYSSATIVFYIWQHAFGADEKGFACAAAWVLALIIFAVTAIQFKMNPASENYLE